MPLNREPVAYTDFTFDVSDQSFGHLRAGQWGPAQALANYLSAARYPADVRGYVSAPTGSGKTVIFARMLEDLRAHDKLGSTLIVEPTNQLVEQTLRELPQQGFKGRLEKMTSWQPDRGEPGVKVTTYAGFTKKTLEGSVSLSPEKVSLLVFDEAHHLQGESTQRSLARYNHAAIIGFTASPDYDDRRRLNAILPHQIYHIRHDEAVQQGLIAPYTTILLETGADMSEVGILSHEYDQPALERAINRQERNIRIAEFYAKVFKGERALFNTGTVAHAEAITEALRSQDIRAETVHGGLTPKALNLILQRLHEGETQALTQARLLGEGYDEPRIGLVFNVNPTLSVVRAKQRTGRAGRTDPDNPHKVMLVVECLDSLYRRYPLFYGHARVAGAWQLMRNDQAKAMQRSIVTIPDTFAGMAVIKQPETITELNKLNEQRKRLILEPTQFDSSGMPCRDVDPDIFFPTRGQSTDKAKVLCAGCPATETCLLYAMTNSVRHGVWGGTSERERRQIRRVFREEGMEVGRQAVRTHVTAMKVAYSVR